MDINIKSIKLTEPYSIRIINKNFVDVLISIENNDDQPRFVCQNYRAFKYDTELFILSIQAGKFVQKKNIIQPLMIPEVVKIVEKNESTIKMAIPLVFQIIKRDPKNAIGLVENLVKMSLVKEIRCDVKIMDNDPSQIRMQELSLEKINSIYSEIISTTVTQIYNF